ncbi:MAG: D-alanyl-D-alanine carboxypeptidase [Chloroflexota bacterium]|nr:D-alanyl-D-alanine carboxypeptidase [Chloroflexota bacterium]
MNHTPLARLFGCMLVLCFGLLTSAASAPPGVNPTPSDSDRLTQTEMTTLRATSPPPLTARAAVLMDTDTGRVLWSQAGDRRLPMASTTKMMTALLASELAEPDEVATVQPRDLVSGSTIHLKKRERITIEQLLYGALIQSGNDAAVTIADHVGREHLGGVGDEAIQVFVNEMNERARRMGLLDTHFENPNGFDAPGHYSSALDLARLGREVLKDPLLANIVATAEYRVTGYTETGRERIPVYHHVKTTNELLGTYRGANGIKTGTTPKAGEALVASVRRGDSGLIAVVLGSSDRFSDVRSLFDWGFARYQWLPLAPPLFDSPARAATGRQPRVAAVQRWNTDLTFYDSAYWVATEMLYAPANPVAAP